MLQRLAQLRKNKNWSLQETADRLGIAKSTYAGYESGYREPPIKALTQMADLFETSVDYILNRIDDKNTNLELTDLLTADNVLVSIDEIVLSKEELIDFIAFTRVKRGLK